MIEIAASPADGNGELLDRGTRSVVVAVRPDPGPGARQWFHVEATGDPGEIALAGVSSFTYPVGLAKARIACRAAGGSWRRIGTILRDDALTFRHAGGARRYAPTPPHEERHLDQLLARAAASGVAACSSLATTAGGRAVPVIEVGRGPLSLWVIARQHGGEPPAGWCCDGLLRRLLDRHDPASAWLRAAATTRVVPLANPDGARKGFLRATAAGLDPNRMWRMPSPCAEVEALRSALRSSGVDLAVDLHADFVLPYPYVDPADGWPEQAARLARLRRIFERALETATPDFQTTRRYPYAEPPAFASLLDQCAPWIAAEFDALALTLELPSGDFDLRPDPDKGWSPARSMALGGALVGAMAAVLPELRR